RYPTETTFSSQRAKHEYASTNAINSGPICYAPLASRSSNSVGGTWGDSIRDELHTSSRRDDSGDCAGVRPNEQLYRGSWRNVHHRLDFVFCCVRLRIPCCSQVDRVGVQVRYCI